MHFTWPPPPSTLMLITNPHSPDLFSDSRNLPKANLPADPSMKPPKLFLLTRRVAHPYQVPRTLTYPVSEKASQFYHTRHKAFPSLCCRRLRPPGAGSGRVWGARCLLRINKCERKGAEAELEDAGEQWGRPRKYGCELWGKKALRPAACPRPTSRSFSLPSPDACSSRKGGTWGQSAQERKHTWGADRCRICWPLHEPQLDTKSFLEGRYKYLALLFSSNSLQELYGFLSIPQITTLSLTLECVHCLEHFPTVSLADSCSFLRSHS